MKKIAIPVENDILCSHFGHCAQFSIIETNKNEVVKQNFITPPPHEPGLLPKWLAEQGVTTIIAGGIGQKAINLFNQQNIEVHFGAKPKKSLELVNDLLKSELEIGNNACDH